MAMAGNVNQPFLSLASQALIAYGRTRTLLPLQCPAFDPILPLWIHLWMNPSTKKMKGSIVMNLIIGPPFLTPILRDENSVKDFVTKRKKNNTLRRTDE